MTQEEAEYEDNSPTEQPWYNHPFDVRNALSYNYINLWSIHLCLIHSCKSLCSPVQDPSTHNTSVLCRVWPGRPQSQKSPTRHSRKQMCTGSYHSKGRQLLWDHSWADRLRRPTHHLQVHGRTTSSCYVVLLESIQYFFFIIGSRMSSISHPYLPGSTCRWTGRLNTSGRLWSRWGARVAELHCSHRGGSQMVPWAGVSNPDPTGSWECLAAEGSLWSRQHLRRDGGDVKGCSKTIKQRVEEENTDQRWLVPALGQPIGLRQELEGQGLKLVMWD